MKTPRYLDLYQDIKRKIEEEVYSVGVFLPTEHELQDAYGVSRTTVRKAIAKLQAEGLILVKQGYGTEIIRRKVSQSLNGITSVSESLKKSGYEVGVSAMHVERISANYELAKELNLNAGDPVILISRIQTADGNPVAVAKNYIPEKFVPGIIDAKDSIVSLYQYLKDRYGINITRVEDRIGAVSATFDESIALNVEPKSALIIVRRICYQGSVPFEVDFVKINAKKYEYRNNFEM